MTLFDSHLHFDDFHEAGDTPQVVDRARAAGVSHMIAVGGSIEANHRALQLTRDYPGTVFGSAGFDRDQAGRLPRETSLSQWLNEPGIVAVGETGLDYHYSADTASTQKALFARMLDEAHEAKLPTIVHSREADEDTLAMLSRQAGRWTETHRPPGVLHCFTGSLTFAHHLIDLGIMISFSGILSFKNAEHLREVAAQVPDDSLLIETDAPYLAPVPYRGRGNEPAFVVHIAEVLADVRACTLEHIAEVTSANAERLFGIGLACPPSGGLPKPKDGPSSAESAQYGSPGQGPGDREPNKDKP